MTELYITPYTPSQAKRLIGLWNACFPTDSPEYIARFIQALPADTIFLVGEMEASPVTMACLIPACAHFRDRQYAVRYLYAGCTHPLARGCGYYRQLMTAASVFVGQLGEEAIYLHPANKLLEASYCRMGYLPGIAGSVSINAEITQPVDSRTYLSARSAAVQRLSHLAVAWDLSPQVVAFFIEDAVADGATASYSDDGVCLSIGDECIEAFVTVPREKMATHCLWISTKPSPLRDIMQQYGGFTGLVGD